MSYGEISERCLGQFDDQKPIWKHSAKLIENFLLFQVGGAFYRSGTIYIAGVKTHTAKVRLMKFRYSTSQAYVIEVGNLYFRFFANKGQVVSGGSPVEIVTPYAQADIFSIQMANKADVGYIFHGSYAPYKLVRTSATTFTINKVNFIRGPFLDTNVTTTTITPSADAGAGITLTASTAIFSALHVGSLWRIKSGVVKITAFGSATSVTGDVQAEPTGVAGALATGPAATTDWAEGAYSDYRGWPTCGVFHENRLVMGGSLSNPGRFDGSITGGYDNFSSGTAKDGEAYSFTILSDTVCAIRWMSSNQTLQIGTTGGTVTVQGGAGVGITPTNISVTLDTDYAVASMPPTKISSYLYYLQSSAYQLRQLVFDLYLNKQKSEDMTLLADHILRDGGGAVDMDRQQSPNDRIWTVRSDGQIAVFTRNAEQQVMGWNRIIAGSTASGAGLFESICILQQDNDDDVIYVAVKRIVNGVEKRYIEYFSPELFSKYYEPNRLDASLSYNVPITITGIANATIGLVTTLTAHGFSIGDQIKIDNVVGLTGLNTNIYYVGNISTYQFQLRDVDGNAIDTTLMGTYLSGGAVRKMYATFSGLDHLEGETVSVFVDGGLPAATQTFLVSGGAITLPNKAAVVYIGLPYTGTLQLLPLGDGSPTGTGQGKMRRVYLSTLRLWKSLGGRVGLSLTKLSSMIYPPQTPNIVPGHAVPPYTGDIEKFPFTSWGKYETFTIVQDKPLPIMILSVILQSEETEK